MYVGICEHILLLTCTYVHITLLHTDHHFSSAVVKQIGPEVNQWTSIHLLVPYLNQRHLLDKADVHELSQSSATGNMLGKVLLEASQQPSKGENLVAKLYLALLDMFHNTGDAWCHYAAFYVVMKQGTCTCMCMYVIHHTLHIHVCLHFIVAACL